MQRVKSIDLSFDKLKVVASGKVRLNTRSLGWLEGRRSLISIFIVIPLEFNSMLVLFLKEAFFFVLTASLISSLNSTFNSASTHA